MKMASKKQLANLFAALIVAIAFQSCGKSSSSTSTPTGYTALSVKCGDQACVK
jgi:hypothetical protein